MNTHADKTTENKSQSVSAADSQFKGGGESSFQFVDNRPEAIAQRKLQEMANSSPQAKQAAQLQAMVDNFSSQQQQSIQKKENNIGLPDNLKAGMENLSGMSLDNVKVHRNSDKPAQIQAHAYAQGTDIHLGPGQEKHLPHEAWHVVQQKQGKVKTTVQMKGGVNLNDDARLEKEADVMGAKATKEPKSDTSPIQQSVASTPNTVQRVIKGLETYTDFTQIPQAWVDAYIHDLQNDRHSHTSQSDIYWLIQHVALLSNMPENAQLVHTGGNHWDIQISGDTTFIIETKHDGSCGLHTVFALMEYNLGHITSAVSGFTAPDIFIMKARQRLAEHYRQSPEEQIEAAKAIALAIRDNDNLPSTGFGASLQQILNETGLIDQSEQQAYFAESMESKTEHKSSANDDESASSSATVGEDQSKATLELELAATKDKIKFAIQTAQSRKMTEEFNTLKKLTSQFQKEFSNKDQSNWDAVSILLRDIGTLANAIINKAQGGLTRDQRAILRKIPRRIERSDRDFDSRTNNRAQGKAFRTGDLGLSTAGSTSISAVEQEKNSTPNKGTSDRISFTNRKRATEPQDYGGHTVRFRARKHAKAIMRSGKYAKINVQSSIDLLNQVVADKGPIANGQFMANSDLPMWQHAVNFIKKDGEWHVQIPGGGEIPYALLEWDEISVYDQEFDSDSESDVDTDYEDDDAELARINQKVKKREGQ